MSSGRTPAAFRLRNAVKEKPVIALTVPRINEGSRSGTSMLTHSTESGWMPTARAKTGNRRRGASPTGAPSFFPTRSCGDRVFSRRRARVARVDLDHGVDVRVPQVVGAAGDLRHRVRRAEPAVHREVDPLLRVVTLLQGDHKGCLRPLDQEVQRELPRLHSPLSE